MFSCALKRWDACSNYYKYYLLELPALGARAMLTTSSPIFGLINLSNLHQILSMILAPLHVSRIAVALACGSRRCHIERQISPSSASLR